jgi:hypothetical protein
MAAFVEFDVVHLVRPHAYRTREEETGFSFNPLHDISSALHAGERLQKPGRMRFEYNPPSPIDFIAIGAN